MKAFDAVSTSEEVAGLESNVDHSENGFQVEPSKNRCGCRYAYIPPKVQLLIAGLLVVISLTALIIHSSATGGGPKGEWPPPGVSMELYADSIYKNDKSTNFMLKLETKQSYRQFTKMTTSSKFDFGESDFAEELKMMIDGKLDVQDWIYEGKHEGYKIGVIFDKVAVDTQDSNGDSTYYNSMAENGDTNFDSVLQSMVGENVYIDVDENFEIVDEEDNENTLEKLEQEYSFGTTTGLSAIDQVAQIVNLKAFLPKDFTKQYKAGDKWDFDYMTDVDFFGFTSFDGWVKYNGYECAVLTVQGSIDVELENLLANDDLELNDDKPFIEIEDGDVKATIFWDVNHNLPRFSKLIIHMTTKVDAEGEYYYKGEDGQDYVEEEENILEIPMTEILEMYLAPM